MLKRASQLLLLCVAGGVFAGDRDGEGRNGELSNGDRRHIEQACTDLVLDYAYFRDRPDAEAVALLFTEDAVLRVLGQEFVGHAAIRARLAGAAQGPVFRHFMSTIRISVDSPVSATGVSYVTVYSASPGALPRPLGDPLGVGEYHDVFVRTDAGWKIQRREFVPVFMPAPQGSSG